MKEIFDAFWRAAAYCLHPRVILYSLLPLAVAGGAIFLLGNLYWTPAVASVRATLESWSMVTTALEWLDAIGLKQMRALLAPMIIVALALPVLVVATLLLVTAFVTPAVVRLVASRRFQKLEKREGGGWFQSFAWSAVCTLVAVLAMMLSIPLWLIPPLILVLPPLIWGWLTYRVMSFDVLGLHATTAERRQLMREHRWPLFAMGVVCGYLGAVPSLLWGISSLVVILAPVLVVASVWLYTLVFAFAAAWFSHYLLAQLQRLRAAPAAAAAVASTGGVVVTTDRSNAGMTSTHRAAEINDITDVTPITPLPSKHTP
jgi:Etoposide-induced protein 2.4 (EI24)